MPPCQGKEILQKHLQSPRHKFMQHCPEEHPQGQYCTKNHASFQIITFLRPNFKLTNLMYYAVP